MSHDARFGLPLSLVEALELDSSPQARDLAALLQDARPAAPMPRRRTAAWAAPIAALAAALAMGAPGYAAAAGLEGRWVLAPQGSSFAEGVTGLAPDHAVVEVSHDDAKRFAYKVVESRDGVEVARAAYAVAYADGSGTSRIGATVMPVAGARDADGGVVITAPAVAGLRASIRFRSTGGDTAELEHAVEGPQGATVLETLRLTRSTLARAD